MSPVHRSLTRPKLIRGIEWQLYYLIVLGCLSDAFYALWEPRRLLLLPLIYFGPYTLFRWAGKHDPQWSEVYPQALRSRAIFYAQSDPHLRERASRAGGIPTAEVQRLGGTGYEGAHQFVRPALPGGTIALRVFCQAAGWRP